MGNGGEEVSQIAQSVGRCLMIRCNKVIKSHKILYTFAKPSTARL